MFATAASAARPSGERNLAAMAAADPPIGNRRHPCCYFAVQLDCQCRRGRAGAAGSIRLSPGGMVTSSPVSRLL